MTDATWRTRLVWGVVVTGGAATVLRTLSAAGVADHWLTVVVLGVYPWLVLLIVGAAGAVALGVWIRDLSHLRIPAAALGIVALAGGAFLVPRTVARPQPPVDGPVVTIGVINVRRGLGDARRIAQIVENTGVDVLAVIELTEELDGDLRRAGLAASLPQAIVAPTRSTAGGGVYTSGTLEPLRPPAGGGDTPDVLVTLAGAVTIHLTTTHPVPPIGPARTGRWKGGLARIHRAPEGEPTVVVGDLNATLDHQTFQALLERGWRDAAREAGAGLMVTYDGLLGGSPGLPMALDHVLVSSDIAVESVRAYAVDGTDHRFVVADLRLPERS